MKPFDLELALAGEPVLLKNGQKAYIKYNLLDYTEVNSNTDYPLRGFYITDKGGTYNGCWTIDGLSSLTSVPDYDVTGMWEEPRPTVQLTLPCPLKEPQDKMWYIDDLCDKVIESTCDSTTSFNTFNRYIYFASEEDAQAWINAMRNSRR